MTILVTGGTGFMGGRLVEHLIGQQQASVRALVRDYRHAVRLGRFALDLRRLDLGDDTAVRQASQGCQVIYHLAHDFSHAQLTANLAALHSLAKAALHHGSRLIYTSSAEVYGWPSSATLDESYPYQPRPGNVYAHTKTLLEKTLLEYHHRHGLEVVILQPTIVYGPYCQPWTMAIAAQMTSGQSIGLLEDGLGLCNAVYIDDVIHALTLAADAPQAIGQRFLINGPQVITWRTFYAAFEAALGLEATVPLDLAALSAPQRPWGRRQLQRFLDPMKLKPLRRFPWFNAAYLTTRFMLPHGLWIWLQAQVKSLSAPNEESSAEERFSQLRDLLAHKVVVPPPDHWPLYQNRATVSHAKARQILGYQPRFSFEEGMALTAAFLRWPDSSIEVRAV